MTGIDPIKTLAARCVQLIDADRRYGQPHRLARVLGVRRGAIKAALQAAAREGVLASPDAGRTWKVTDHGRALLHPEPAT